MLKNKTRKGDIEKERNGKLLEREVRSREILLTY